MSEFLEGQMVRHANGVLYKISKTPDHRTLEYCDEPFYEYELVATGSEYVRRKSEMEDGRFTEL